MQTARRLQGEAVRGWPFSARGHPRRTPSSPRWISVAGRRATGSGATSGRDGAVPARRWHPFLTAYDRPELDKLASPIAANRDSRDRQMSTTARIGRLAPRITVCCGDGVLSAALRELVAAGWRPHPSLHLDDLLAPPEPTWLCIGTVRAPHDVESVATLLAGGVSAAVECCDQGLAVDLYDQCSRLGAAEWFDTESPPPTAPLDELQISLLCAIATGHGVVGAARVCHLSARTAARRIAEARDLLRARSTADAAARVRERVEALGPAVAR